MRIVILFFGFYSLATHSNQGADGDWSTYMRDNSRSGVVEANVEFPLRTVWTHRPSIGPRPAWRAEALMDGYNKVFGLVDRQSFDKAFHVVGDQNHIYYGSSATDQIYCLNTQNGEIAWRFFAEGPIRFAPTLVDDWILFGSDDGYVYCLERDSGELVWRALGGERNIRIPGNGRLISKWPVRTGLVVYDQIIYGSAGMFPADGVFLFALDLRSGETLWRRENQDLPAQGYMLCSDEQLYVPSGRSNPVVYSRSNGDRVSVIDGQGGTFCLLTSNELISGPGKLGQLGLSSAKLGDRVATLDGIRACVQDEKMIVLRSDSVETVAYLRRRELLEERKTLAELQSAVLKSLRELAEKDANDASVDRNISTLNARMEKIDRLIEECILWTTPISEPRSLIVTAEHAIVGCARSLAGIDLNTGDLVWSAEIEGTALGLAWISGRLFVSSDTGEIYCFEPDGK